ncbi:MAG: hypothetical protein IJT43_08980 [Stomatobaculum sp.]|nr:hypothetical protein [Stomatobaculum sp.]
MSKHTILFACGHIADAEVEGSEYQKKQKLIYLKICGRCPDCEKKHRKDRGTAEEDS